MAAHDSTLHFGNTSPDVKYIGDLTGSYLLASREHCRVEEARVFGCRSRSVTPHMAVLQAPVKGAIGEKLALKLDTLGLLRASISRITADGFAVDLLLARSEMPTIVARIDWLRQKHLKSLPDRRRSRRWLPRDSHSTLILPGNREVDCFLIDVSASGAAISADVTPGLGHAVVVGAILGRVVRRLEFGFAVQFLAPQDPAQVEALLAPVKQSKRDALANALAMAEAAHAAELARLAGGSEAAARAE